MTQGLNRLRGLNPLQPKADQTCWRGFAQEGAAARERLQVLPELVTALANALEAFRLASLCTEQLQGLPQSTEEGHTGGGNLKTATIAVPAAAGTALLLEAAPADQGGLALIQEPLGEGHSPQALGAAAPLVTGEGVDVGCLRRCGDGKAAQGLGCVHQQPGVLGVRLQVLGPRGEGHHGAGVAEEVGEVQESGPGSLAGLELLQNGYLKGPLGGGLAELQHRQGGQGQVVAAGQFLAGRDHAWVLAVTDQQLIALLPGQAPEGQDASTGDVLCEGNAMGADPTPARQASAQAAGFLLDEGPDIGCKWPQLLNGAPTGCDGLERWGRQRPLTAVVEVGLVDEGRAEVAKHSVFSSVAQAAESGPGRAHPRCRQSAAAAGCHPISLGSLIPLNARGLLSAMEAEEPEAFAAAEPLVDELPLHPDNPLVHLKRSPTENPHRQSRLVLNTE